MDSESGRKYKLSVRAVGVYAMPSVVCSLHSFFGRISQGCPSGTPRLLVTLSPYHIIHAMSLPHRPLSLTITALGIFLLAMWNLWRAWIIAQQSRLLEQIGVTLDPHVRLTLAVVWALAFLLLAGGLWRRRAVVRIFLPLAVLLYGGCQLLLLLFAPAPAARQGWVLQLLVYLAAGAWTAWLCLRPAHRDWWRDEKQNARGHFLPAPFTLKVVQRGQNGKSKD